MNKAKRQAKKIAVGIIGGLVVALGVVAIPYPGPGWLIVFSGLAILSTEFAWAKNVLTYARGKYDDWQSWLSGQKASVRLLFWIMTASVVVLTLWLLNGYGFMNDILGLGWDWVESPLPIPGK